MIVFIIIFDMNVGFVVFVVLVVFIFFNIVDEGECIKLILWSMIVMVFGVGVMMIIVDVVGGIDLMSNVLLLLMNSKIVILIMSILVGFMFMVSFVLVVVYLIMMFMCVDIVKVVGGVDLLVFIVVVGVGGFFVGVSLFFIGGVLILVVMGLSKKDFNKEE